MADQWTLRGIEYGNCNCDWGCPCLGESTRPGDEHRIRIELTNGFEYTVAEMGTGTSTAKAGLEISLENSYGQFNTLHMNQDGIIR